MKHSAGIILVDLSNEKPRVLCLRAYKNWDWPKGRLDPGENHIQAAIRELEEETGYTVNDIEFVKELIAKPEVVTYGSGKSAKTATYFYAALINTQKEPFLPINPELGHPEHEEWRWVQTDQLHDLMPARLNDIVTHIKSYFS